MLIHCPSCATSYDVDAATLQPDGRRVRCVRCRNIWLAEPSHADKLLAAAEALGSSEEAAGAGSAPAEAWEQSTIRQAEDGDAYVPPTMSPSEPDADATSEDVTASAEVDSPPIAPSDLDDGKPPIDVDSSDEPAEDIETYAARREKDASRFRFLRWPLSRLQSGVMVLLIVDAILIGWRDEFVRVMPQTASFYSMLGLNVNLRGMAFDGVSTRMEQAQGAPVLVVEGNIVNAGHKLEDLPRVKFSVRNASGQEVYSWTTAPPRPTLPPGETVAFQSSLASPPVEAHDVLVRFVTRRDIVAGAH